MTTLSLPVPHTTSPAVVVNRAREALHAVRYAPVPRWHGGPAAKARFLAYVVGSSVAWTVATISVIGLAGMLLELGL